MTKGSIVIEKAESEDEDTIVQQHTIDDVLPDNNFNVNDFGMQLEGQQHYISPLLEIFETEFTNKDYVQDLMVNGFTTPQREEQTFKYDFLLSEVPMLVGPAAYECLDIEQANGSTSSYNTKRYERAMTECVRLNLGEPVCMDSSHFHIAVGLSTPNILLWRLHEQKKEKQITLPTEFMSPTALSFSHDSKILSVGSIKGDIGFIDVENGDLLYHFQNIYQDRLIALKVVYNTPDYNNIITASCSSGSKSFLSHYQKGIFKHDVTHQVLTKVTKSPCNMLEVLNPDIQKKFVHEAENDPSNSERRIIGAMNAETLWILSTRIHQKGAPQLILLYEFQNPHLNLNVGKFMNCFSIGYGFIKRNHSSEFDEKILMVCSWNEGLYFIEYSESRMTYEWANAVSTITEQSAHIPHWFASSKMISFQSRIVKISFIDTSLIVVVTLDKGVFLVNSTNLRFFKEDKQNFHIKALVLRQTKGILNFKSSKYHYLGSKGMRAKHLFKMQVNKIIGRPFNEIQIQHDEDYSQFLSSSYYNGEYQLSGITAKRGLIFVKVQQWEILFNILIQDGDWTLAMQYIVSIYNGTCSFVTKYLDYDKEEVKDLLQENIQDLAFKYHKLIIDSIRDTYQKIEEFDANLQKEEELELLKKSYTEQKTVFSILIEFLLLTDSHQVLFQSIMRLTEERLLDKNTYFLSCLEPFYPMRYVRQIPSEKLNIIIDYYRSRKDAGMIQKLVQSLDHSLVETSALVSICLKCGLMKSLAIICEGGDIEEILTPIVQIWCHILNYIDKGDFEMAQYFLLRVLTYIKMNFEKKLISGSQIPDKNFGQMVKTIMRWTLTEDNLLKMILISPAPTFEILLLFFDPKLENEVPKLQMDEDLNVINELNKMILQYKDWFEEEVNPCLAVAMLKISRVVEQIQVISQQGDNSVFSSYRRASTSRQSISQSSRLKGSGTSSGGKGSGSGGKGSREDNQTSDLIQGIDKGGLISLEDKDFYLHFIMFQLRLFMNQFLAIRYEKILQCVEYVLKNVRALNTLYLHELFQYLSYSRKQEIKLWPNKIEVLQALRSDYIVSVLKVINDNQPTPVQMKMLTNLSTIAENIEVRTVCIFLAEVRKEYKRAFDFFLFNENNYTKQKIFTWIRPIMEELEKSQDYDEQMQFQAIKDQLLIRLTVLVKINSQKTRDIIARFQKNTEEEVISKLGMYPDLQLEYVENILQKEREEGNKGTKEMLILHITLMCKLKPTKIVFELENNEYPLEFALKICREAHLQNQVAYILIRLGSIQEAMQIYLNLLEVKQTQYILLSQQHSIAEMIQEILYSYERTPDASSAPQNTTSITFGKRESGQSYFATKIKVEQQLINQIDSIINKCINNNDTTDEIWYMTLDCLIGVKEDQKNKNNDALEFIQELCTQKICQIIVTIAKTRNMDTLLQQLQNRYTQLDLGQIKDSFIRNKKQDIFNNYGYVENIYVSSQTLVRGDIVSKVRRIQEQYKSGVFSQSKCCECNITVNKDGVHHADTTDVIVFRCGHAYHHGCVIEQQKMLICQKCCNRNQSYVYSLLFLNNKISLDKLTDTMMSRHLHTAQMNDVLQEQIQEQKLNDMMNDNGTIKKEVSKEDQLKRTRRTNKMKFWDKKKDEHILLVDQNATEMLKADKKVKK